MTVYLDTSALAKLLVNEKGSAAVRELVASTGPLVSSALAEVELMRVAHRLGAEFVPDAQTILRAIHIAALTPPILRAAANMLPASSLRSLDAIHLATASAMPDLVSVCTYDIKMLAAAAELGLTTLSPA